MNTSNLKKVFEQDKENYEKSLRLEKILNNQQSPFRIIVYGKYNHGKSTFLNAWLKQKELFKTSDKRETIKIQEHLDKSNNILWIDTPGLDADLQDDAIAKEAVKNADIILLVHDIISGELDKEELKFIETSSTADKKKLKLLLTKIDQKIKKNEEDIEQIIKKIEIQVKKFEIQLFPISPIRYQKYIEGGSEIWKQKSGFDKLECEIKNSISNRDKLRSEEIRHLCDELIKAINTEKREINLTVHNTNQQIQNKQNEFSRAAKNVLAHF